MQGLIAGPRCCMYNPRPAGDDDDDVFVPGGWLGRSVPTGSQKKLWFALFGSVWLRGGARGARRTGLVGPRHAYFMDACSFVLPTFSKHVC